MLLKKMAKLIKIICTIILLFVMQTANSQNDTVSNSRPKVGLVLSGGGAKGAAHIGVIKYIEEQGIPIDFIAGTSMGSVIGGMYALGYTSDEILDIVSQVDWDKLISDNVNRREISYTRKHESVTQLISVPFSVTTDREELQSRSFKNSLPTGIVSGDNLINLFNSLSVGYSDSIIFNDLPIPFICIATNMMNGEADVLNKGVFSKSLRASTAIPILFEPISIDNTLYTDGGLVNNFPAEQCRAMGADYVIGVSMSPGLESNPQNLSSIFSQVKQLKEIITDKEFESYKDLCDIFISPELNGVGMLSFNAESVARMTESGYIAATNQNAEFQALKEKIFSDTEHRDINSLSKQKAVNILNEKILISGIELEGVGENIEKWVRRRCTVQIGDYVCKDDIDKSVSIYYGTGNYESVTYTLHKDKESADGYILRFAFVENPPHDFGVGFRFDSQDMLSVLLNIGLNSNRISGFRTDVSTKLGSNQWLNSNFSYGYQIYPRINLTYNFRNSELDVYDMDELVMNMKFLQHKFKLYLSENYSRTISVGAGIEAEFIQPQKVMYSLYNVVDTDYKPVNTVGTFAFLKYDNLNQSNFPTNGAKGEIAFKWRDMVFTQDSKESLGLGTVAFGFESYVPIVEERFVLIPQLYGSFLFGKGAVNGSTKGWNSIFQGPVPCYPALNNMLGGTEMGRYIDHQLPFVGLNEISLAFNNLSVARLDIRTRVFKKHYLTAMFNYGRSSIDMKSFVGKGVDLQWDTLYDYNASNWWGAGIRYSIDTKMGPLSFDVSSSNITLNPKLYFSLGYYF